ncbi:pumilio homolog 4-like isoform X1 [Salvia hispanica]|uniref:pumilio homolog 4-like isoform X1 n=1 Tax=Salvia hispanica TaxID=49212 RepID=UPI0020099F1B|nr:pumilio homolog 4-like isoform X1 [Salvia hispanica]XP_047939104.1 pumilio homolog 4-like isoform X1 [Salvia hispanica]XP_047939105.1 pumilio homolog 4-like isoform X1 [Salvia hispanica]
MMRGSSSNEKSEINASLESEIEALLLHEQRNRGLIVERERGLDINRSGSAPPSVEGALLAAGSLLRHPNFVKLDSGGSTSNSVGVLTEEEIRSHPAYLEYYYSHQNFNPRLPPPLLSKEDWRVAQRVRAAGRNGLENGLYSMPVALSVKKAEDEMIELRKAALRNMSRKNSTDSLEKGMMGASSSGMGVRRKSFADILQEGCGQPTKSHLSRPASQSSVADIADMLPNSSGADLHNKAESFEALHPKNSYTVLSNTQSNPSSLASCVNVTSLTNIKTEMGGRPPAPALMALGNGVHLVDNLTSATLVPSPGIFEIADIASSLSGLKMSMARGQLPGESISQSSLQMGINPTGWQQQHYSDSARVENMVINTNYVNLARSSLTRGPGVSKLTINERVGFPRRTSSTTNLQSQHQHSLSDLARLEDLKNQMQNNNSSGVSIPSQRNGAYSVEQKQDGIIGSFMAGGNGDGQILRPSYPPGFHIPVMDPHQVQYIQKMSNHGKHSACVAGNSSQGLNFVGSHGHDNFQSLEKAYLEALLLQQAQQFQSHILQKPGTVNHHQYQCSPGFNPYVASFQGNMLQSSRDCSRSSMVQNEKCAQIQSSLVSQKGENTGSCGSNSKGRFESLLEMLKNNKTKSLELSDILGHVVEFSTDQFGSRFIQQKLETATVEEKTTILLEILPNALGLMIDVFGNYVIQKFFEHGTEGHRKELARHLIGHVLPLTLQMYGCRVIQKALEVIDTDTGAKMAAELDGSVMKCIHDQNGNHVIQKCIECIPQYQIHFIISSFFGQVVTLSTHPYGCRVIQQRVLEHCDDPKTQQKIMDEIMNSVCKLAQDQYGNYVIQHVVEHGRTHERATIISKLAGQIVKMSQQKFASNVVEKCLAFGGPEERKLLVNEILGSTEENEPLQAMMKDPFGNYVVQKVLETCDDKSRELILSRIKVHLSALKRYTYGKHIVSRVEKLIAAGERHIGQSSSSKQNS